VVFIGPTDLSQSLGVPGQTQHPTLQAAMDKIIAAVAKSPAALGIMVPNVAAARLWAARGARYIAIGMENLLVPAARDYLKTVHEP
jgi:4-hydroxy-2-oxoheptanedioate aldolase